MTSAKEYVAHLMRNAAREDAAGNHALAAELREMAASVPPGAELVHRPTLEMARTHRPIREWTFA